MSRKLWVFAGGLVAITLFFNVAGAEPQEWPGKPELLRLEDSTITPETPADFTWISTTISQESQPSYYPSYESCNDHRCGWYAGVEIVIVKPYWEDEVDTVRTIIDGDVEFPGQLDPDYDCSVNPRLYLGYRNCGGLGARVRYWVFDKSANPLSREIGNPPIALFFLTADLNVKALDLEATKLLYSGPFQLEVSGGARYGKVRADVGNLSEQFGFVFDSIGSATFEGVGPTISAEARHQLGCSRFAVVGNIRGSLLFGHSNFFFNTITSGPERATERTEFNDGNDDVVPTLESQFGLEWSKCFTVRRRLALRAMMEGQWWGVSTPGASFPIDLGNPGVGEDTFTTGRDLGFFGVTAAIIYEH